MRCLPFLLIAVIVTLAHSVSAQSIYSLDGGPGGVMLPTYLPSPSYPAGGPGFTGPVPIPMSGVLGAPFPGGGIAIDQTTSRVFATDGFVITTDYHNLYLPFTPPVFPPPPVPAPILLSGGPITGMGCDPTAGTLWLTDGMSYAPAALGAPFGLLSPAMPVPFPLPPGARLTGIDFEASSGTLWGVDSFGSIYHWTPFGAAIGPQPVAVVPATSVAPMTGIAVNEANGAGAVPAPFCSTQLPGYHIVVSDGAMIYDALGPNPPIPVAFSGAFPARGLAYSADMQYTPGAGAAPIATGFLGWSKPQHNGPGGLNALRLTGAEPSTLALFLYDSCPIPGGLFVPFSGETLWINPLSPTFLFATLSTDAAGEITAPLDLSFALAGITFTSQWALYSPLSPLGYALTDAMTFTIGMQ